MIEDLEDAPPPLTDGDYALAPPPAKPAVLTAQEIRRLGALTLRSEHFEAVEDLVSRQREVYQRATKEDLIEALCARDRQLAQEGRQLADGRIGGRLLREFVRGVLAAADSKDPQRMEKVLQALGAEPADARQLKLHGTTLGTDLDQAERAEDLASGKRLK